MQIRQIYLCIIRFVFRMFLLQRLGTLQSRLGLFGALHYGVWGREQTVVQRTNSTAVHKNTLLWPLKVSLKCITYCSLKWTKTAGNKNITTHYYTKLWNLTKVLTKFPKTHTQACIHKEIVISQNGSTELTWFTTRNCSVCSRPLTDHILTPPSSDPVITNLSSCTTNAFTFIHQQLDYAMSRHW